MLQRVSTSRERCHSILQYNSMQFSTCTNPIVHLFYPPKYCIIIVCNFSRDMKIMSQEKSKTMPKQIFWGIREVYYRICASRECSTFISTPRLRFSAIIYSTLWVKQVHSFLYTAVSRKVVLQRRRSERDSVERSHE